MIKQTFQVIDMHCANCSMNIEAIEDDLSGIKQISASYHKMQMTVEYDETKVSQAQILEAVKNKGYTAIV